MANATGVADFVHSLCTEDDYIGDLPTHFEEWSGCFPDIALLLPAHGLAAIALLARHYHVRSFRSHSNPDRW